MNFRKPLSCACLLMLSAMLVEGAEETTQVYLSKYGDKLAGAWASHPTEKDALIRKQKIADLTIAFTTDYKQLAAPANITMQKVVTTYLSNLEKVRGLFKTDKMNAEKGAFVQAASSVYKYELPQATDSADERKASKCFDQLVTWTEDARGRMRVIPDDAHGSIFGNLNEAFSLMMRSAVKDDEDPTVIYEKQLKEVQRRFPVSTVPLQKLNNPAKALLETAAKVNLTFNKK